VALDGVGWYGGGAAFEGGLRLVGAFECSWIRVSEVERMSGINVENHCRQYNERNVTN
jgi:hypothetical protein